MLLLKGYTEPNENHQNIIISCCIPSQISIPGNAAADKAGEHAMDLPITKMGIHYEGYKLYIKNYIDRTWQGE